MTNEELYQLMKDGFDQVRLNFDQVNQHLDRVETRLDGMDARLRTVENGISERKGKQSAIARMLDWITIVCAISAIIISIAVAIFK